MSDWLSEIEDINKRQREQYPQISWETPRERMARVIRELARVAKRLERCDTDDFGVSICPFCGLPFDHKDCIYSKLSPDAKELLKAKHD